MTGRVIIRPNLPSAPKTPPGTEPKPFPWPGGNPPGNKRPPDQDDCEEICVEATPYRKIPKKIRYQYPGESPVEVEGESFSTVIITPTNGSYLGNWTARGFAIITCRRTQVNQQLGNAVFAIDLIPQPSYVPFGGSQASFFGRVTGWEWVLNPMPTNGYSVGDAARINVNYIDGQGISRAYQLYPPQQSYTSSNGWNLEIISRSLQSLNITPVGTNTPPPNECRFRIFNAAGQTILDITRDVCPTATVIPEKCELRKGEKETICRYKKLGKYDNTRLEVETRGSCIDVYLKSGLAQVPFFKGIKVAEKCSDQGCPAPEFKIDCCKKRGCEDKKCPPGTVTRVLIGRTLQCVDSKGCVIKEIIYDPKCEKVDCRC